MLLGLDINKIVEYQKLSCRKQLNKLIIESKSEVSPIEGLTIQYVIGHIKATINWLEVVQNSIKI